MLELSELTYAAIITIELPGMRHPATISLTLMPPDVVETTTGEYKALRDCTLSDLQAFADAMEAALWEEHRHIRVRELVEDEVSAVKITLINEGGKALAVGREQVLEHVIQIGGSSIRTRPAPSSETVPTAEAAGSAEARGTAEELSPEDVAAASEMGQAETDVEQKSAEESTATEASEHAAAAEASEEGTQEAPTVAEETTVAEAPAVSETPAVEEAVAVEPALAPLSGELRIAGLRRPLGHPTPAAVDILINEAAMRDAQAHALSSMDREVAGMLIGPRPEKQPDGRYVVYIADIIIARHTRMMGASVTYTPESWRYVTDKLQEMYPNEEAVIVGWYHTHPGFGIFLSGMDLFIHQNFFTQRWHVALVLDPRAARMGFFCWDRRQKEVQPYEFPWPEWAAHAW